jgi:hypothetical protein
MGLLESSMILTERMSRLQDPADALALIPRERLHETGHVNLPQRYYGRPADDQEPPDYGQCNDDADISNEATMTTTMAMADDISIFTGLTLADLSALSLIPLPLNSEEVKYGRFYTRAFSDSVRESLEVLLASPSKYKSLPMCRLFGLRAPGAGTSPSGVKRRDPVDQG